MLPKAVVFLGGGVTEIELLQAFRANDIRIVLVDRNACAPGREFADEFIHLSVTDTEAICEALYLLLPRYCFVAAYGIVDYAFRTIAIVAERLRIELNPPQIYEEFINKLKTKARFEKFNVPTPKTVAKGRRLDEAVLCRISEECGSRLVVIKANDTCNSEGVRIVRADEHAHVRQAIGHAIELSGEYLCEEFISGTLHNLDVILSAGAVRIVAITDRYRMTDGVTSIAGLQQTTRQHSLYAEFEKLAVKTRHMFAEYSGPLTADILVSNGKPKVLEMSPHLHAAKLQWLRDPEIVGLWPRMVAGRPLSSDDRGDSENASAYVRIYDEADDYKEYFDSRWVVGVETFEQPRCFGLHKLRKILYMKAESGSLLRERLEAFVHKSDGSALMNANRECHADVLQ